ncbi:MAG: helix-turn-helix transcriptional regulator [Terrimicrobiaceae bacterium]
MKPFPHKSLARFSRNLRRQRRRMGFTQERLAEKLDIFPRHYQKLEAATVTPTFGVLLRVKRVLKAGWDDLFGGL